MFAAVSKAKAWIIVCELSQFRVLPRIVPPNFKPGICGSAWKKEVLMRGGKTRSLDASNRRARAEATLRGYLQNQSMKQKESVEMHAELSEVP